MYTCRIYNVVTIPKKLLVPRCSTGWSVVKLFLVSVFHMASRRMIPTRIPIRHYQMTETILNYREILIVWTNNLLLCESTIGAIMPRTSGLSGPSHANGQDRKPEHKTDISATIVKDRNYWYLKFITSVNILNKAESLFSNTLWYHYNKLN